MPNLAYWQGVWFGKITGKWTFPLFQKHRNLSEHNNSYTYYSLSKFSIQIQITGNKQLLQRHHNDGKSRNFIDVHPGNQSYPLISLQHCVRRCGSPRCDRYRGRWPSYPQITLILRQLLSIGVSDYCSEMPESRCRCQVVILQNNKFCSVLKLANSRERQKLRVFKKSLKAKTLWEFFEKQKLC